MTITIKTPSEIEKMRAAGRLAAEVLEMIAPYVTEGITTEELNKICHDYIVNVQKAIPAPLNYKDYPKSICTSINHQICHGIPGPKKLKNGDILNIDITIIKDGFHGDTSKMFALDKPSILAKRLIRVARECLFEGIKQVKPGKHFDDIGSAIQQIANRERFSIVREFCGHGIGQKFHEEPSVLHYKTADVGVLLKPGMTFTIEPMINAGKRFLKLLPNGWTAVTKDHSLSAQWEHTLLVTDDGCEILTLRKEEKESRVWKN